MKVKTVYEAENGAIFETAEECKAFEKEQAIKMRIYKELRHADTDEIYDWIAENTKGFKL